MPSQRHQRGFTLVELMVVVVIVGVLSVLAVTGYRKYTASARNAEAVQFLGAIRAAQETYFQAFGQYCGDENVATWPVVDADTYKLKKLWGEPPGTWGDLGVRSPGRVWFVYNIAAGAAGDAVPGGMQVAVPGGAANPIQSNDKAWYVANARGDHTQDGVLSLFEVTSEKPDVFSANEKE